MSERWRFVRGIPVKVECAVASDIVMRTSNETLLIYEPAAPARSEEITRTKPLVVRLPREWLPYLRTRGAENCEVAVPTLPSRK
ncbi:hypothetical protein [Consotaella salsifontis]|uniref:Uncharacterized protein n=1 Tax=Consotaella salsifontis TaxID=1365950 RepID=A0A1T4T6C0_9HYPH|nr:hypothetical protein [Consotaella salsifontis]SKA36090.1 hypothetical protein SAMN05428963_12031 [Consotaella salsifontis]